MKNPIAIVGIGCVTSVGLNAAQTAASVRAGISRFAETRFYGKMFEPILMGYLTSDTIPPADPILNDFPDISKRQVRILQMSGAALAEAVGYLENVGPLPILWGLPETLLHDEIPDNRDLLNLLSLQSRIKIDFNLSKLFAKGRAAGILAINDAVKRLERENDLFVVVGGGDSYYDSHLLKKLDNEGRLNSNLNMNGFIPGEGAAFIILTTIDYAKRNNIKIIALIEGIGLGFEDGHRYSNDPYRGDGLAAAFSELFKGSINNKVKTVYAGFNGENYDAKQWGVAAIRNTAHFNDDFELEHPADCTGDTGAATSIIMTALSIYGIKKGYRETPILVWSTSDHGQCGAIMINLYKANL